MATTGFWPVKGNLKATIDYAENPDKTTDRKFLDDDLYNTLQYAQNDQKTDQKMYVSAINCPPQRAYEAMMDTKRRFGKVGGNVAYHGYQSFKVSEVTPEEAHQIGKAKVLEPQRLLTTKVVRVTRSMQGAWHLMYPQILQSCESVGTTTFTTEMIAKVSRQNTLAIICQIFNLDQSFLLPAFGVLQKCS